MEMKKIIKLIFRKWFTEEYMKGFTDAQKFYNVFNEQKTNECQCKTSMFTRVVDEDYNSICGNCGKKI